MHNDSPDTAGFLQEGGWNTQHTSWGREQTGMSAHRGVLHPDEYVDWEEARRLFEQLSSFTVAEAQEIYNRNGGPVPAQLRKRRDEIDRQILEMGNLEYLAEILGVSQSTLERAARRARLALTDGLLTTKDEGVMTTPDMERARTA